MVFVFVWTSKSFRAEKDLRKGRKERVRYRRFTREEGRQVELQDPENEVEREKQQFALDLAEKEDF